MSEYLPEIAIAAAIAWAGGIRLYATLFIVGLAGKLGWVVVAPALFLIGLLIFLGTKADYWQCALLDSIPGRSRGLRLSPEVISLRLQEARSLSTENQ